MRHPDHRAKAVSEQQRWSSLALVAEEQEGTARDTRGVQAEHIKHQMLDRI